MRIKSRTQIASILGIIAIVAVMAIAACDNGTGGGGGGGGCDTNCRAIGSAGEAGGKIIYHNHSGFNVAGIGTCYYLEAAPENQAKNITWCNCTSSSWCDVKTGTAIGTGKANTDTIIAHANHNSTSTYNCAAKAAKISFGGKNDWFLPSLDELNEMYKARSYLGIPSAEGWFFWSSSQYDLGTGSGSAYYRRFNDGLMSPIVKSGDSYGYSNYHVRAVRAF